MLQQIINLFHNQGTEIWHAVVEHVELSLLSLLIAALIAIPAAILLTNHRRAAEVVLQITSIFQTIPSLALLGLLIPFVGIGTVPAVIALVAYAVMPLFQNTYTGLTTIDPNLEEAATAFGLSRWRKLQRLELPLAMPLIISGLRIATVTTIGTATLAALIGAGGLGTYIMLGIQTNNNAMLLVGAILSVILALLFSGLIRILGTHKFSLKKVGVALLTFAVLGGGFLTYRIVTNERQAEVITIAGKLGSEPEILINMYRDLIEAENPQVQVQLKPNFGGTTFLYQALKNKQIDLYPEFTGTVLQALVKVDTPADHDPQETYQLAQKQLQQQDQLTYLKPMAYQNGYDLAVTQEFADKYQVTKISDLPRVAGQVKAAFDHDFYQQPDGYQGLQQAYGLDLPQIQTVESSLRYKAIASGKVNLVDGYTTDPEVAKYHLVVLEDDLKFFPPYQGAPLMRTDFAKDHPEVVQSLNKLAGKITTAQMQKMNYQVTFGHQSAAKVAHNFLLQQGLLKK